MDGRMVITTDGHGNSNSDTVSSLLSATDSTSLPESLSFQNHLFSAILKPSTGKGFPIISLPSIAMEGVINQYDQIGFFSAISRPKCDLLEVAWILFNP